RLRERALRLVHGARGGEEVEPAERVGGERAEVALRVDEGQRRLLRRRLLDAEHPREERLGVEVDDEDAAAGEAGGGGEVDDRGGLPRAALVVADGDDGHRQGGWSRRCGTAAKIA